MSTENRRFRTGIVIRVTRDFPASRLLAGMQGAITSDTMIRHVDGTWLMHAHFGKTDITGVVPVDAIEVVPTMEALEAENRQLRNALEAIRVAIGSSPHFGAIDRILREAGVK